MHGFLTALKSELYVAQRSSSARIILLAPTLLVLAQLLLSKATQTGAELQQGLGGSRGNDIAVENAYGYFVDALNTGLTVLFLCLVAYSAWSFAQDRDSGVIRHLIIRRVSRSSLLLAKLFCAHFLALISLLLLLLANWLLAGMLWEFGPVVEDGFELIGRQEMNAEVLLGFRLAVIPLPAAIAFGVLISVSTRSVTQAVTTALGLTIAADVFKGLLGNAANYLYVSFHPSLIDQSYLNDVSRLVRGYSDVLIDDQLQSLNLWVPIPQMLFFIVLALIILQKRKL